LNVVSRNLELPKKFNSLAVLFLRRIKVDWCRMGNRTENRMGIQFACKLDKESDAKKYV
jgi:hypothetical protein